MPNHLVIIPDGNRRWAKQHGLDPWLGHEEGAKNIENLVRKAFDLGIRNLSFWGSSIDNLTKRPLEEKRELLRIYEQYFQRLLESKDIFEKQARINVIGRWREQFPQKLKSILEDGIEKTKSHVKCTLNFFLAYNGDDEMVETIKKIVGSGVSPEKIDGDLVKQNLMTAELPAVDFLIRTGKEAHLSAGFMMWDTANSELFFADQYFPDFGIAHLEEALDDFSLRRRKKGA